MVVSWLPEKVRLWEDWSLYRPRFGFERVDRDAVVDARVWSEVAESVRRHAAPKAPIFVAITMNTGHHSNMPFCYWFADLPPGSRFVEFDPCLTDPTAVQWTIVDELREVDVSVATGYFPQEPSPGRPPSTVLDDYLDHHFVPVNIASLLHPDDMNFLVRSTDATTS